MSQPPSDPIVRGLRELAGEIPPTGHMRQIVQRAQERREHRRRLRRVSLASTGGALLLAALLLIPISYPVRVGSLVNVEWVASAADGGAVIKGIESLEGRCSHSVRRIGMRSSAQIAFRGIDAREAERRVAELVATYTGQAVSALSSRDIVAHVGGNALAAMTGGTIRIHVRAVEEEDIEVAIAEALVAYGAIDPEVDVSLETIGDTLRILDIDISAAATGEGFSGDSLTLEFEFGE